MTTEQLVFFHYVTPPLKVSKFENDYFLTVIEIVIILDFAMLKSQLEEKDSEISYLKEELRSVRQGEYTCQYRAQTGIQYCAVYGTYS